MTSHRSRCSGPKDLKCGRDYGRQKEALTDPVILDLESPVGMVDLDSRQDLGSPGLGTQVV